MPISEDVLAQVPGLGAYLAKSQYNREAGQANMQRAVQGMGLAKLLQDQEQAAASRQALAESGGDPEAAMAALIKSGNVAGAHQLAPVLEQYNKSKQAKLLQGLDMNDPAAMERAGIVLQKPDFITHAERLRTNQANQQTMGLMKTTPAQPAGVAPADELGGGPAQPAQEAKPGVFADLMQSKYPEIASRAKSLQSQLDQGASPTQLKFFETQQAALANKQIAYTQADATRASNQQGKIEIRNMFPPVGRSGGGHAATQGAFDPVTDKEAIRDIAVQSLYDPNATTGYRRDTKAMAAIQREKIAVMKEAGITSEDVVSGRAGFKADTASLNKITPQYDAIVAFEKTAVRNGEMLKTLADKVDTTGVPVVERWIRAGRKSVAGDTDVAKFDAQIQIYRTEAARILVNPNLTGVLSDSARHEIEAFLPSSATAPQIRNVVDLLKNDFDFRKAGLEEQISSIRTRMRGRVAPSGATPDAAAPQQPHAKEAEEANAAIAKGAPRAAVAAEYKKRTGKDLP